MSRLALRAALLCAGLLMALVGAELYLRSRSAPSGGWYVWWPGLQYVLHPATDVLPGIEGDSRFRANSLGLRGDEPIPRALRILCVGGSTTECIFLDQEETWPQRVQRSLGERGGGRAVQVWNAGKAGLNSREYLAHVRHLLPQLEGVQIVLLLVGVNDLMLRLGQDAAYDPRYLERPEAEQEVLRRAFQLRPDEEKLALVEALGRLRDRFFPSPKVQDRAGEVHERWRAHRRGASRVREELPDLEPALEEFRRNLEAIARTCAEHGARVVLLTQPSIWRTDLTPEEQARLWMGGVGDFMTTPGCEYYGPAALAEGIARYNEATRRVAAEAGLELIDLAERVPRRLEHFYDDVHFNERGAELVAELVAEHLLGRAPFGH